MMDRPEPASKKRIAELEFDLMRANDRLDEAQSEVDWLQEEIARMKAVIDSEGGDDWEIVAVQVTPEMLSLAEQARGKRWEELRPINRRYERLAVENAVYMPIPGKIDR